MTEVQKLLTIKYRKLFGVSKLLVSNDTTDIIFDDQISNNYSSVVGNCIVNNNLICDSLYLLMISRFVQGFGGSIGSVAAMHFLGQRLEKLIRQLLGR